MPQSDLRSRCRILSRTAHKSGTARVRGIAVVALLALSASGAYTVRAGDTLSEIAQRHGTTVTGLVDANDVTDPDLIYVGQTLTLPEASRDTDRTAEFGAEPATHRVRPGESLGSIAERFGLSVEALARANGITNPSRVMAGALLRIASEAPPPPGLASAAPSTHIVKPGQTLSGLAARYGTSVSRLVDANELPDANHVIAGRRLRIPGTSGSAWACPWSEASYVNDFGVAKPNGRYHEGIDVFAPDGSEIRAPVSGIVEQVTGDRAGKQFTLRGDDGYTYIGSHMASFGASGRVEAGAVIGTVGDSGNAKGAPPHTHFQMHNGGVVNPAPTLQQYCG